MSLINNFDTSVNFWKAHPDMKISGEFKKLYESDKTKDKSNSSLICWFIVHKVFHFIK